MTEYLTGRASAKLSVNRALWDMVTPGLRGVAIRAEPHRISGRFLYEAEPDDEEREIVSEVETEVIADYPPDVEVTFRAEGLPPTIPRTLQPGEEWVYLRREYRPE
jgi:hypothetical protein